MLYDFKWLKCSSWKKKIPCICNFSYIFIHWFIVFQVHIWTEPCGHFVHKNSNDIKAKKTGVHTYFKIYRYMIFRAQVSLSHGVPKPYKTHQITKLKCLSSHHAVVCVQSIEARCYVENDDVAGAAPREQRRQAVLRLHLRGQQFHCLWRCAYIRDLTVHFMPLLSFFSPHQCNVSCLSYEINSIPVSWFDHFQHIGAGQK